MERFSLAGGQGWLTVEESGGRARCAAELPEDGKGLYKGYLCGTGGRALLGTFLPEDGLLARAAGGGRALYRPEPEGFSLAFPYAETRAFPLTPLFCFARMERMNGEFYAVFPFWPGGCPRLPHKPAQAGQTIGANQTKEETRHGEPNHQGADRPVRPAQF